MKIVLMVEKKTIKILAKEEKTTSAETPQYLTRCRARSKVREEVVEKVGVFRSSLEESNKDAPTTNA